MLAARDEGIARATGVGTAEEIEGGIGGVTGAATGRATEEGRSVVESMVLPRGIGIGGTVTGVEPLVMAVAIATEGEIAVVIEVGGTGRERGSAREKGVEKGVAIEIEIERNHAAQGMRLSDSLIPLKSYVLKYVGRAVVAESDDVRMSFTICPSKVCINSRFEF